MPNFLIAYKGEATDMADMTPEEGQAVMEKWGIWMGKVGESLVDVGSPFGPSTSLVDDGSTGTANSLTGYSILAADDLDGAKALCDGHPYLSEGRGDYGIDIYELMPVPM